jgi:hypothetical protein
MSPSRVCLTFDFDALSVWLDQEPATPAMLHRGEYGARVVELLGPDRMHEHVADGLLTVCMHPQVIARGHRIAMLERFVEHCTRAGARFARMGDVATELG